MTTSTKSLRELVQTLPSKRLVFAFGRFQPPTAAHYSLISAVKKISEKHNVDHMIYVTSFTDAKRNPLSSDTKIYYLNRAFPKTNFVAADASITSALKVIEKLASKYRHISIVCSADSVKAFEKVLSSNMFETSEVISIGAVDPDSNVASAKMIDAAKRGDYDSFRKGISKTLTDLDSKRLMNEVRQGVGLEPIKHDVKFQVDEIRETYYSGNIFKVGDIVECSNVLYQIKKRGANHLLLQDERGNLVTKWPRDVTESDRTFVLQEGLDKMKFTQTDRLKVAKIIASSLGLEDVDKSSSPEQLMNAALRKIRSKQMRPEYVDVLNKMLQTAREADIKYDEKLVPQKAIEEQAGNKENESDQEAEHETDPKKVQQKVGHSLVATSDQHRKMKVQYQLGENNEDIDDLSDHEIDALIFNMGDDDYLDAYDEEELAIVDADTGEKVEDIKEEALNEVLSRTERIKAKVRFARTASKRARRLMVALKTHSSAGTINKRARRLAVNLLKKRLARGRPLSSLSVGEKERIERVIQKRKNVLNRIAMKLAPRVRKIESARLAHHKFTKGAPA